MKNSYLKDIQQEIDNTNDEIKNAEEQKDSLKDFNDTKYSIESNNKKLESLQNDQLKSISTELVKDNSDIKDLNTNIREFEELSKGSYVKAKVSGMIHMNNDALKGAKYVGSGSEMAEIYPNIKKTDKIRLMSYVSSRDISSVKKGQHLRLVITRNVPRPIIIDGKISNISVAPVPIDKGTYYVITATSKYNSNVSTQVHYGMSGKTNIITGRETFFKYYKDKLLDKN